MAASNLNRSGHEPRVRARRSVADRHLPWASDEVCALRIQPQTGLWRTCARAADGAVGSYAHSAGWARFRRQTRPTPAEFGQIESVDRASANSIVNAEKQSDRGSP